MNRDDSQIQDRLGALEAGYASLTKKYRALKWINGLLVAAIALGALMGAGGALRPDVVSARGFVLLGEDGKPKATLGVNEHKTTALDLLGPDGEPRLLLGVTDDGGALIQLEEREDGRCIYMALGEKQGAIFGIRDADKNHRIAISLDSGGTPEIKITDADHEDRIQLTLAENGTAQVGVSARDGKGWVGLGAADFAGLAVRDAELSLRAMLGWKPGDRDGRVGLSLLRPDEKARIHLDVLPDDVAGIYFQNGDEKPRIRIEDEPGILPAMLFRDDMGNELFRVP